MLLLSYWVVQQGRLPFLACLRLSFLARLGKDVCHTLNILYNVSNGHARIKAVDGTNCSFRLDLASNAKPGCIHTVHPVKRCFPLSPPNVIFLSPQLAQSSGRPCTRCYHPKPSTTAPESSSSDVRPFAYTKKQYSTPDSPPTRPAPKPYPTGSHQSSKRDSTNAALGLAPSPDVTGVHPNRQTTNKPPPRPAPKPYPTGPHQSSVKKPNKPPPRPGPKPYPTGPHQS
jgi:hypothetical protein